MYKEPECNRYKALIRKVSGYSRGRIQTKKTVAVDRKKIEVYKFNRDTSKCRKLSNMRNYTKKCEGIPKVHLYTR